MCVRINKTRPPLQRTVTHLDLVTSLPNLQTPRRSSNDNDNRTLELGPPVPAPLSAEARIILAALSGLSLLEKEQREDPFMQIGIFRQSGSILRAQALASQIEDGKLEAIDWAAVEPNTLVSLIKSELAKFGALVPTELKVHFPLKPPTIEKFRAFMALLPAENRIILTQLLPNLKRAADNAPANKMTLSNLVLAILEPKLFSDVLALDANSRDEYQLRMKACEFLIDNAQQICGGQVELKAATAFNPVMKHPEND